MQEVAQEQLQHISCYRIPISRRNVSSESHDLALQGIRVTHQEFCYGDGTPRGRAIDFSVLLQGGAPGQDCNGFLSPTVIMQP